MMRRHSKASGGSFRRRPASIDAADAIERLKAGEARPDSLLAYGNGRSYGDTLPELSRRADRHARDGPHPRLRSGDRRHRGGSRNAAVATSSPMPRRTASFPQVVPGTQFVTLGGAIANDVHGKNHHRRGTFGRHVESFDAAALGRHASIAARRLATPGLFEATIGGMGLTGLILSASIRLMRVPFARHRRAGDAVPRPRRVLRADRRGRREQRICRRLARPAGRRATGPAAVC